MKVAFVIPSTTNNRDEWSSAEDTYLWQILCMSLDRYTPQHDIKLFIGYDEDDRIYSVAEERLKFNARFDKFRIEWFPMVNLKGKVTSIWNKLGDEALKQNYDYIKVLGDDIRLPNDIGWLGCMINKLKKNDNIGFSSGWSNNDQIPTQFLIHRNHINIFGFIYPHEIPNWGCDNWMYDIYPEKYRNWIKSFPLLNVGGQPRYQIHFSENFVNAVVRRYKPKFNKFLSQKNN
tara:strand:+ start:3260 stop:3955 length:696 start_codon:yes stop_codon:yes gene_type:complete